MFGRFAKGMIVGGIIGAMAGMVSNPEAGRRGKRLMRKGKHFMKDSGRMFGDLVDWARYGR